MRDQIPGIVTSLRAHIRVITRMQRDLDIPIFRSWDVGRGILEDLLRTISSGRKIDYDALNDPAGDEDFDPSTMQNFVREIIMLCTALLDLDDATRQKHHWVIRDLISETLDGLRHTDICPTDPIARKVYYDD